MNKVLINISSAEDALNTLPALPFNDREQLPGRAGIYIVTLLKEQILYIGKTKNFNTRWLAHHKLNEIKDGYGTDKILIAFCELSENEIDISEAALIKK
ncbi:MAG: GIY-YIG nuclease family protein, partial [Oceanobacter sp.]